MGNEQSQGIKYGARLDNDVQLTWSQLESKNQFAPRDGHVSCDVNGSLYVFGGVERTADGDNLESQSLLKLDIESSTWSQIPSKGDVPAARSAATMTCVNNNLYIFGGLNQTSGWLQDIYVFNTETGIWTRPDTKGAQPSPRDKLKSVAIGTKIYFFGGFGPKTGEDDIEEVDDFDEDDEDFEDEQDQGAEFGWFNDIFVFDTESNTWSNPMQMNLAVPTPRAAHGMCAIGKNIVIFGGRDTEARRNDLHIFNTETMKWETELQVKGRQPEPRSFHTCTAVNHRMVVMGGRSIDNQHFADFHILDTETKEWLQPSMTGPLPSGRGLHSATRVGDYFVMFGGSANFNQETNECRQYFNDVYYVKTEDILKGKSTPIESNQENVDSNVPIQIADGGSKTKPTATESMETSTMS
ncbi:unnamed protein product [Owenia fusiformis]|uniref:Uncharacterized protein n=1 Tax=Owenia fusiformis TaxID=6347 RepID=A0A8J1TXQ6_OWEFU|nr:unnamed protein product [Owenia fusiformis]